MATPADTAKKILADLRVESTTTAAAEQKRELIGLIKGQYSGDFNAPPEDGSEASWQEDRAVRAERFRQSTRQDFDSMLTAFETTERELRALELGDSSIFPAV